MSDLLGAHPAPRAGSSSLLAQRRFSDRVIVVTGATGGLGRAISRALALEGAIVVLHGRVVRKLEALYDAIVADGGPEPAILPLDYERATSSDYSAAADAIDTQLGRLDGIVHCAAALTRLAPIEHHTPDDWATVLRVNLSGPAALTRALFSALRRADRGTVVFTLDSRGHVPAAYWGSYAASKAGVEALVRVLVDEWRDRPQLAAYGVIPGPIDSPMRKRTHPGGEAMPLRPISDLVPLYLQVLLEGRARFGDAIIDAAQWPRPT